MSADLSCYRCGASLASLSLPLSHRDECPSCSVFLHVCRMCLYYDPRVPRQCREDGAEDVKEKERPNFCDWFKPQGGAFDASRAAEEARARAQLDALFGGTEANAPEGDDLRDAAEDLFR